MRIACRRAALCALALAAACCGGREADVPKHLVLVSVDTLRADHLGAYGSALGLTPHLDALARESVVFERTYAPASFTLPSVSALLTGRHPVEIDVTVNEVILPESAVSLAAILFGRGFGTAAVVSNYVLRRASGLDRGFDRYDDRLDERASERGLPERPAHATTQAALAALDALDARGGPFFLWVHYQDPHGPYTPPRGFREAQLAAARAEADGDRALPLSPDYRGLGALPRYQVIGERRDVGFYRAGYRGEVAYLDTEVGRLLDELRARGLLDRSVLVLTADHGEGLGERDYWFAHGEHLTDPLVRVPLLFRVPGRAPGHRADPASLLDVLPTLAGLFRLALPEGLAGRDLFAAGAEGAAPPQLLASLRGSSVPRFGLVEDGHKLLVSVVDGEPRVELHTLADESRDLAAQQPDLAARLHADLRARLESLAPRTRARPQRLGQDERDRLRALGYVQD